MREKLKQLAQKFPKVIKLETAESKYGIPYLVSCQASEEKCVLDIVTLTDFESSARNKV